MVRRVGEGIHYRNRKFHAIIQTSFFSAPSPASNLAWPNVRDVIVYGVSKVQLQEFPIAFHDYSRQISSSERRCQCVVRKLHPLLQRLAYLVGCRNGARVRYLQCVQENERKRERSSLVRERRREIETKERGSEIEIERERKIVEFI